MQTSECKGWDRDAPALVCHRVDVNMYLVKGIHNKGTITQFCIDGQLKDSPFGVKLLLLANKTFYISPLIPDIKDFNDI